jgi:hypothetical protein
MKTKIFKLLSVVMALAMVFSMFACVAHAEEAETVTPVMVQGTVDGQTGAIIPTVTTRISTQDLFAISDFDKAIIASGYKAYFHFYDANGTWKASCGAWQYGNVTIGTMSGVSSETVSFRVVVGPDGAGDLTPADFPADGLKLVPAVAPEEPETPEVEDSLTYTPEMTMGNVKTAVGGGLVFNPSVNTRITSKDLIAIADIEKVEIAKGYKAWYYTYTADGILTTNADGEVKGSNAWKTGTYTAEDLQKISDKGVYFSVTVSTDNNDAFAEAVLPEGVCVITKVEPPVYAEFTQGTIDKDTIHAHVNTRFHTAELLNVTDYKKISVAKGYKIFLHFYNAEGKWVSSAGWIEAKDADVEITGVKIQKDAGTSPKMRIVVSTLNNDALSADTLPKTVVALRKAPAPVVPEMVIGNVKTAVGGGLVINSGVNTRITTKELLPLAGYEKIKLAAGYKAWYYTYDAAGILIPNGSGEIKGSNAWIEGDYSINKLTALSDKGVYFSVTVATNDNAAFAEPVLPEGTFELIVAGAYGACAEHEVKSYTSNNDATCLEDGTKSGACSLCGEIITLPDEFSAKGHQFSEGAEACDVCGEARVAQDTCTHKYGKYTSNNDATCEENGTKSATCLICGKVDTVVEENTAKGHTVDYKYNNDATCTEDGTQSGVCSVCNKDITVPVAGTAKGHTYDGMDDFSCNVCFTERKTYNFFASESRLGGADNNDGLSAATPVLTVNKVIDLANAAGAAEGDIVKVTLTGTVEFGNATTTDIAGLDLNTHKVMSKHNFILVLTSEDGTATLKFGKNLRMGGPTVFDNVTINTDTTWQYFAFGGHSFTLNADFGRNEIDGSFGQGTIALDIRKETNITFNGFMRKFSLGNAYNDVNFYENYNINFTHMNENVGEGYYLCFGGVQQGNTIIHKGLNIVNTGNEPFTFAKGTGLVLKEGAYFNFINNFAGTTINLADLGLSAETAAKTWVLNNVAPNGKVDYTDVAGEFKVSTGYVATATALDGSTITSVAGKLTLPAGQYAIDLVACADHVYDDDADATCNNCGAVREVYVACEHEWSAYVSDENATCTDLGTETATCNKCGEEDCRPVEGTAPGHQYDEAGYCTACNIYKVTEPTMVKEANGKWYFYKDGYKLLETTLIKYSGKWFYLEDGEWDSKVTTLVKYEGKWFWVRNGKWDSSYTNKLVDYSGKKFYIKNGKWDSSINGRIKIGSTYYLIKKGKWSKTTELYKSGSTYYYMKSGKWSKTTGIVKIDGTQYYVKSGKWSKTTTLYKKSGKYYAIKSGKVTKSKVIIKYNGKKYYCYKGYAQTSYSGKVTISGKKYTVKKGIIK